MARGRDQIDKLCEDWARIRRELLGLSLPLTARGYVGALRCTLAARRDLHAGSRSEGLRDVQYPEVYTGDTALVNAVYWHLQPGLREILDVHYVVLTPRNKGIRADLMGISLRQYWDRVARAKCAIEGGLAVMDCVRTLPGNGGGITRIRVTASALPRTQDGHHG